MTLPTYLGTAMKKSKKPARAKVAQSWGVRLRSGRLARFAFARRHLARWVATHHAGASVVPVEIRQVPPKRRKGTR